MEALLLNLRGIKMGIFTNAAYTVLKEEKHPLSAKQITEKALNKKLIITHGRTPQFTMTARIIDEIKQKGKNSRFKKVSRGLFYLS